MPSFKSACPRQVQFIGPQFLPPTARHYKIQIWPGTSEKVGAGREVTSSNQDSRNNVATLVCSKWVSERFLQFLSRLRSKFEPNSSVTKVCQVVVLYRIATTVQTRDKEFPYIILLQAAVSYQVGRDSCPHIARTSTQPAVLLFALSISPRTVLPGLTMSEDLWNALYRAQFHQYGRKTWKR